MFWFFCTGHCAVVVYELSYPMERNAPAIVVLPPRGADALETTTGVVVPRPDAGNPLPTQTCRLPTHLFTPFSSL